MKIKRIFAYLFDILFVSVLSSLIFMLPFFKEDLKTYNNYLDDYSEKIMESGSADLTNDELNDLQYNVSKASSSLIIIRYGLLFLYFGVFAFIMNGKTFGKMIFKLQIVPIDGNKNLNPGLFILRQLLVTGFIFEVISLLLLMLTSKSLYMSTSIYVSYASVLVYFLLLGFIIFRDDERGLRDVLCKTKVISTKKEK